MDHGGLDFGSSRVALYSELVRGILDLSSTALTLACLASDFKILTSGQLGPYPFPDCPGGTTGLIKGEG